MKLNETGQLLTIYFAFIKYLRKTWEYNEAVHMLFIDFKTAYDSVRREVLYVGESNEKFKSVIKIRNTARLFCKLATVILMV